MLLQCVAYFDPSLCVQDFLEDWNCAIVGVQGDKFLAGLGPFGEILIKTLVAQQLQLALACR